MVRMKADVWFCTEYVGPCVLFGMVLTEFHLSSWPTKLGRYAGNAIGFLVIVVALFFASTPRDNPEAAAWSLWLHDFGQQLLPPISLDKYKVNVSFGSLLLVLGTIMSPRAQWLLSRPGFVWLGKISFPLYLLHGTFIRSAFAWVLFAGQKLGKSRYSEDFERYPLPGRAWIAFSVFCLMVPLLITCQLWVMFAEPVFDRIITTAENIMVRKENKDTVVEGNNNGNILKRTWILCRAIIQLVRQGAPKDVDGRAQRCESNAAEMSFLLQGMEEGHGSPASRASIDTRVVDNFTDVSKEEPKVIMEQTSTYPSQAQNQPEHT